MISDKQAGVVRSSRVGTTTAAEREFVHNDIRNALSWGYSDVAAAVYAGVCNRTVAKYRKKHNLRNNVTLKFF